MCFTVDFTALSTFSHMRRAVRLLTGGTDRNIVITDRFRTNCTRRCIRFCNVALTGCTLEHVRLTARVAVDNAVKTIRRA